jgi:hypothetical protein
VRRRATSAPEGSYSDSFGFREHTFVVNEVTGVWRTAQEVPGTAALNSEIEPGYMRGV